MSDEEWLRSLEETLLRPEVRRDGVRVAKLLTDDFVEFGSSGRVLTKSEVVAELQLELAGSDFSVEDLCVKMLAREVALVTYIATRRGGEAALSSLRSSIWRREGREWRMCFHQGTRRA